MKFFKNNAKWFSFIAICIAILSFFVFQNFGEKCCPEPPEIIINEPVVLSPFDSLVHYFDTLVSTGVDSGLIPGIAYCIVKDDSIIDINTGGFKNVETNDTVDINTVFRLASVSKAFASFLTAIYVQDSILTFDEKIQTYLPKFKLKDSVNTANLTLLHVLDHTSGLVPHAYDDLVESNVDFDEIMDNLQFVDICCGPGNVYGYQNVVYSLSGKVLETIENKPYDVLLKEKVFEPLKMKNASANFLSMENNPDIAMPHGYNGKYWNRLSLKDTYYSVAPAAGVNASISDMAIWLKTMMGSKQNVLDTAYLHFLYKPHISTPLKRSYTRNWKNVTGRYYGLGWRIYQIGEKHVVYHGGYVRGYRADIAFCPDENVGIVVLMNGASSYGAKLVPTFYNNYFALHHPKE